MFDTYATTIAVSPDRGADAEYVSHVRQAIADASAPVFVRTGQGRTKRAAIVSTARDDGYIPVLVTAARLDHEQAQEILDQLGAATQDVVLVIDMERRNSAVTDAELGALTAHARVRQTCVIDRCSQARDIRDEDLLTAISNPSPPSGCWATIWDLREQLLTIPVNVIIAKAGRLICRRQITGCACGWAATSQSSRHEPLEPTPRRVGSPHRPAPQVGELQSRWRPFKGRHLSVNAADISAAGRA